MTDRLLDIAEAAKAFVAVTEGPSEGPGYDFQRRQKEALARLVAAVQADVTVKDATDATDS